MTSADRWVEALQGALPAGGLLLIGPGAEPDLPRTAAQRHVPAGTVIPLAEGAKLANPERPVVALAGDADLAGPSLGALLHAARRNTGITCLVRENGVAAGGRPTTPDGEAPLRPVELCLAAGATFVAKAPAEEGLPELTAEAVRHPGFALVNVLAPTVAEPTDAPGILRQEPVRAPFEALVVHQAEPVTLVWTPNPEAWDRILYGDDDPEPDQGGEG